MCPNQRVLGVGVSIGLSELHERFPLRTALFIALSGGLEMTCPGKIFDLLKRHNKGIISFRNLASTLAYEKHVGVVGK